MSNTQRNLNFRKLQFKLRKIIHNIESKRLNKSRIQQLDAERRSVDRFDYTAILGVDLEASFDAISIEIALQEEPRIIIDSTRQSVVHDDHDALRDPLKLKDAFDMYMRIREFQFQRKVQKWQLIFAVVTSVLTIISIVVALLS